MDLVNIGIDYTTADGPKRAEAGDKVADIPQTSRPWLIAQGVITPVAEDGSPAESGGVDPTPVETPAATPSENAPAPVELVPETPANPEVSAPAETPTTEG